jgi:hypothetical protein
MAAQPEHNATNTPRRKTPVPLQVLGDERLLEEDERLIEERG